MHRPRLQTIVEESEGGDDKDRAVSKATAQYGAVSKAAGAATRANEAQYGAVSKAEGAATRANKAQYGAVSKAAATWVKQAAREGKPGVSHNPAERGGQAPSVAVDARSETSSEDSVSSSESSVKTVVESGAQGYWTWGESHHLIPSFKFNELSR